jgi:hypothetical protein
MPMPNGRLYRVLGLVMIVAAAVGYLTVADDLRHSGEFLGVTAILVAGLALVGASFPSFLSRNLSLEWVSIGVIAGAFLGAVIDNMYLGTIAGLAIGATVALMARRGRRPVR